MITTNLPYDKVELTGGFWKEKQDLIRKTTIWNVYKRFNETGRFEAFKLAWKEGMPNRPHIFWDSDIAKWIESVAYLAMKQREPELEAIVDGIVDDIEHGQLADGYFNIYYQLFELQNRFTNRGNHELYCAGHLIEAAVAYDQATGKGKFLALMEKYVHYIKKVFMDDESASYDSPGHEEIELALVKLYDHTGKRDYLDLALFFINKRGSQAKLPEGDNYHRGTNIQDHLPVREQFTAEGHSVRACYLYCAMADLALREKDDALKNAAEKIFQNIINAKMYITGAVGSTHVAEAFEEEYRLPNDTAYGETCASLSLALFARRLELLEPDASYADTIERVIYNGFLSGLSLDGKSFFYENAQEIDLKQREIVRHSPRNTSGIHFPITQRVEVFGCSCCPPNVTRFIASIGDFLYNYTDDTIFVNQFMASTAEINGITLTQTTNYPFDGNIAVRVSGGSTKLAIRVPAWCKVYTLKKNGMRLNATIDRGYAYTDAADGDIFTLELRMSPRRMKANPRVLTNRGLSAICYGPFVMCMEGVDNGGSLTNVKLCGGCATVGFDEELGLPVVSYPAVRDNMTALYDDTENAEPFTAKLIPYFAFANRGECDMRIWIGTV